MITIETDVGSGRYLLVVDENGGHALAKVDARTVSGGGTVDRPTLAAFARLEFLLWGGSLPIPRPAPEPPKAKA